MPENVFAPESVNSAEPAVVTSKAPLRTPPSVTALWVVSDDCFMSGQNLQINGGLTLRRNPRPGEIQAAVGAAMAAMQAQS
jgi:hypothetical protein